MAASADSPVPAPDLGDLMHVAFRRLRHGWSEQLAPFDLTPYQFRALQAVGRGLPGADGAVPADGCHPELHRPAAGEAFPPGEFPPGEPPADQAVGADAGVPTGLRLKDLAERLRIAPRSATEVVDQLEQKGLVERRPDPADRRATRIVLTEDGARMRSQVREERRRQAGDFFSVLSAPDREELARLLTELVRVRP